MEDTKLIATKRSLEGSANMRRMRKDGMLPGIIYGDEKEPVSVEFKTHEFEQLLHHRTGESLLIDVELEGEGNVSVLLKEVQHHPVSSELVHVDLMRISANRAINVDITLELIGEAEGVKAGGTIDHVMHSINVECLPADLVDSFEIDVTELTIGQALHVSDLTLGDQFKVMVDETAIVASVQSPRVEEEEDEEAEEGVAVEGAAEPEVITEKKEEDAG